MTLARLNQVCAGYGQKRVLHDFNARIKQGELIILVGANAAGKTTLIRVLSGVKRPDAGSIAYVAPPRKNGHPDVALAVPPEALPDGLTGSHAMDLVKSALRTEATEAALEYAQVVELAPYLHQSISSYSMGTKQKLAITLALIGDCPLLLLDESLNGLDLPSVGRTLEYLNTRTKVSGQSVLLATHHIDLAQLYAQRIWLLENGQLTREWEPCELAHMQRDGALVSRQMLEDILTVA